MHATVEVLHLRGHQYFAYKILGCYNIIGQQNL